MEVQAASSLVETFYDLNTSTIHPVYPQPTYPVPPAPPPPPQLSVPPVGLWTPRVEGYGSDLAYLPHGEVGNRQEDVSVGTSSSVCGMLDSEERGQGETTPPKEEWAEEEDDGGEESGKDGERTGDNLGHKNSQVAITLNWLTENYERAEGVCLPRCVLYTHYQDFCKKHDFTPAGAASFGKIIRQKFPKLTTRRLGTRGQSKYHYYGIGIKETSEYYHSVYSGRGLTRFSGVKVKTEGSNRKYSLSSKTGTLLPEFPDVNNLILPEDVSPEKMQTVLMMYRTHCQRILDTVISANFDEVQNLLLHFWQGMPSHLTDILSAEVLCDIVSLCDSILYKVLADVLVPSCIQDMPDNLGTEIKVFARMLPDWLSSALDSVPQCLRDRKIVASRDFAKSVSRQLSFIYLAQTSRMTLHNDEEVSQMLSDLSQIDMRELLYEAFCMDPSSAMSHLHTAMSHYTELISLLHKQAPVESLTEWIDSVVDTCAFQPFKEKEQKCRESVAGSFMMEWMRIASLVKKELTLLNCSSFGNLHVLQSMLDEYMILVMDTQRDQARDLDLQRQVQRHMKNAETIKTQAKVRAGANKMAASSPKNRKRKQEEHTDSSEETEVPTQPHEQKTERSMLPGKEEMCFGDVISTSSSYQPHLGTAFTRPPPSRDPRFSQSDDAERLAQAYPPHPVSPSKGLPSSMNSAASYDRSPYFTQFGLNSYTDYVTHNPSLSSSRMQNYADPHGHGQTFPPVSFSGGGMSGSYHWADGRTAAVFTDPYSQYGAHGMSYDTYKNAALLRGSVYGQEAALGLNAARGYFTARASDTFQGSPLAVGSTYGGNFMEIAPSGTQYPRHEPLPAYQDDRFPSGMAPSLPPLHKHYIHTSFR